MGSPRTQTLDLRSLGRGPYATFLWGESRSVLNRVLFAMVRAVDPEPLWLDMHPRRTEAEDPGPVELGWIASDHLFLADESDEGRPQDAVANMALGNVVRSDEPATSVARLADFLRLPPIKQEIIGRFGAGDSPHALAVANAERVQSYYPDNAEGVRPFVAAMVDAPLRPYLSVKGPPGEGRFAFDFVFRVLADDLAHWAEGSLLPEKAPTGSGIEVGVPIPLRDIPGLAEAFAAGPGRKV